MQTDYPELKVLSEHIGIALFVLTKAMLKEQTTSHFKAASAHDVHPHPVDVHVGLKIAYARKAKRLSQSQLGDAIGVTFQQVQKYERGANRVSASTMFAMMHFLSVPPSYFFEGLTIEYIGASEPPPDPLTPEMHAFLNSEIGLEIVETLSQTSAPVQRAIATIVTNLVSGPK